MSTSSFIENNFYLINECGLMCGQNINLKKIDYNFLDIEG